MRASSSWSSSLAVWSVVLMALAPLAASAVPMRLQHQGRLLDSAGAPVNGTRDLTFRLHADPTTSADLWEELHPGVAVSDGYYAVELGSLTALDTVVFDGSARYLAVSVGGVGEQLPRTPVLSVPYALRAAVADNAANMSQFDGITRACPNGTTQTFNGTTGAWSACPATWSCATDPGHAGCVGAGPSSAYASCQAIYTAPGFNGGDGVYVIDPDGAAATWAPTEVYCLMSVGGGGWTQVFNVDTGDGNYVFYNNTTFWTAAAGYGAISTHHTLDFKSATAYGGITANDVLIEAHTEGTLLAWRSWRMSTPRTMSQVLNVGNSVVIGNTLLDAYNPAGLDVYEGVVRPGGQLLVNKEYGASTSNDWSRFVNAASPGLTYSATGDDSVTGIGCIMNVSNGSSGSRWDAGYGWSGSGYTQGLMGSDVAPNSVWGTSNSRGLHYDYAIYVR